MTFLSLPDEVLDIIVGFLNAPKDAFMYQQILPSSTACLCKMEKIYAQDNAVFTMWPEWRRDSLAFSAVCKRLRKVVFDRFWLQSATMEWTSKKLQDCRALLDSSARAKVETLILRGECNAATTSRPTLKDYADMFPRIRNIEIVLVYPDLPHWERPDNVDVGAISKKAKSKSAAAAASSTPPVKSSSLQSVNLAIYKSNNFKGETHKHETQEAIHHFQSSGQLKQLKMKQLQHYHMELTFSRGKRTAGDPLFWRSFSTRIKEACQIPARAISICFGFQLHGESAAFLPKEVETIALRVALEDFAMARHKNVTNMIRIGKEDSVGLIDGYLPSEKSMHGFLKTLRKSRPNLYKFDLIIYCCDIPFTSSTSRQVLQYMYGTSSPETSKTTAPVGTYQVNQLALDNLHEFYLEQEEAFEELGSDAEGDLEEEMEMMIEMEEEAAMY
ncbi:hypothetical protein QFC22_006044 [Naganishia vaughanmartiniae]|uniref:Uncharacterized protein n=1 Tax=Naganishia vaughanmartiniae TaxID=1424756 RepID=A0ACC2WPU8_9TREE|nr:hypothetical protein QFC22_006044 [Naganishia vaughanmartiniae]